MKVYYLINAIEKSQRRCGDPKRRLGFEWDLNKQWEKMSFSMQERMPANARGQD